jgi:phosphopantetheine adenylyltransferase
VTLTNQKRPAVGGTFNRLDRVHYELLRHLII